MVAPGASTCDCRGFNVNAYAESILEQRRERFSTVYACLFVTAAEAEAAGAADSAGAAAHAQALAGDMLLTASSNGDIRLYAVRGMVERWTAGQQSALPLYTWQAHRGPVFALSKTPAGPGRPLLVFSGGDDGCVRAWRLTDILSAAATAAPAARSSASSAAATAGPAGPATQQPQPQPQPCLCVRLPRADSPLGTMSLPPAAQALAADGGGATVYVGCSDGGVFAIDAATGSAAAPAGGCHAAAVLCADVGASGGCLATGSEDGTARLWDLRVGGGGGAVRVLDAGGGVAVGGGAEALRCLRGGHVGALRLEASGSWLLAGCGGPAAGATAGAAAGAAGAAAGAGSGSSSSSSGGGALALWDLGMGQRAAQVAVGFAPQALHVQPAEVLLAGAAPALAAYSLDLRPRGRTELGCTSAFGLDVHAVTGAVGVCGVGGRVELLSPHLKRTGAVYCAAEEG